MIFVFLAFLSLNVFGGTEKVVIPTGELKPFWIRPKILETKPEPLLIQGFTAMVYPVTNKDFLNFLSRQPEWGPAKVLRIFADKNYLRQFKDNKTLIKDANPNSPVTSVSWFAARAYCENIGMRLPTMAEWEYMAVASETKSDATGDTEFLNRILEWYSKPQAVNDVNLIGKRRPNFYGVHDLHGLVWEWVDDFNSSLITGESRTDGTFDRNLFCGAGGMAGGDKENYAAFMRFAFRSSLRGSSTTWNLGFRCIQEVKH